METKLKNSRSGFEKLGEVYGKADRVSIEKELIENTPCYWFFKNELKIEKGIIIYLHGGCFVLGSVKSHQALVSHLADALDIPILFIEYSLAPENPFPAAINEILSVCQHILHKRKIQEFTLMGDSAGAGLSMSVISTLNKKNISSPRRLVMLSPWVDLRCSSRSITTNAAIDPILTKEQLQYFTSLYTGNNEPTEANPVETMFGEFPPTLILVGSREILLDDSNLAYSKISAQQPITELIVYDGQTHVWLLDDIRSQSSIKAIEEIRHFIRD